MSSQRKSVLAIIRNRAPMASTSTGQLLEGMTMCDCMLIYLNALTWTHEPELFAAEIREVMRQGV
jgi:hypothetical protein